MKVTCWNLIVSVCFCQMYHRDVTSTIFFYFISSLYTSSLFNSSPFFSHLGSQTSDTLPSRNTTPRLQQVLFYRPNSSLFLNISLLFCIRFNLISLFLFLFLSPFLFFYLFICILLYFSILFYSITSFHPPAADNIQLFLV